MKKQIHLVIIFFLGITLFAGKGGKVSGSLVIIGGALNPDNHAIYNKFIELGKGKDNIRIAIIPAASINPVKSGQSYIRDFMRYGVPESHIKIFPLAVKDDPSTKEVNEAQWSKNGSNKELAEEMRQYNAVFLVGGDQARYRETLIDGNGRDLPLLESIREIFQKGGVIGGTSAGAAIMSDPMIISGNAVEAITAGVVFQEIPSGPEPEKKARLTRGFGFFKDGIIDQHFLKRGRMGRLIPAVLHAQKQQKHSLGFGVDEDTAIVYRNHTVEVIGTSGILIIDTSTAKMKETQWGPKAENIILHYLEGGDSFNLETGEFLINAGRKKIKKGKEYYKKYPLDTNIFGKDAVKEILTAGLVDNYQDRSEGLSFTLDKEGSGIGMQFIFKKTDKTIGYFGKIDGKETFSALHVAVDFFPITVSIKPAM
jgi:cyanophycinase